MLVFAWGALILWPAVGIILYQKYSLPVALCVTLLGGYLLLPTQIGFDLPLLPELNKLAVPALTALMLAMLAVLRHDQTYLVLKGWLPRHPIALILLSIFVVGGFGTIFTNTDSLHYGPLRINGLRVYDAFALLLNGLVMMIPLFLGRKILGTVVGQRVLLSTVVISGFAYSFLALYEVRMSPQLNVNIYGFFPHSFGQHMRNGGFRPLVFLEHGLSLSIYLSCAVLGCACLFRTAQGKLTMRWAMIGVWLLGALVLSKSLGALVITLLLLPVILFLPLRLQLTVGACVAVFAVSYPILRAVEAVPLDRVLSYAEGINADRAQSLEFRIMNEEALLEKARERPLFGWGLWSRNRVYNSDGADISTTDGAWIIEFGLGGWFRYISLFGLLSWPIIGLFFSKHKKNDLVCIGLGLVLAAKILDMMPNAGMSVPYIWLIAGSLWGRLEMKLADFEAEPQVVEENGAKQRSAYSKTRVGPKYYDGPSEKDGIRTSRYSRHLRVSRNNSPNKRYKVDPKRSKLT